MQTNDAILTRLATARPGMWLVAHREVAVPLYKLTLDVVVQEEKAIPPIEEYVLRSVEARVDTLDEISAFLGLERRLVEVAVHDLWQRDHVDVVAGRVRLTGTGRIVLAELVSRTPVRREVFVDFDRMLYEVIGPATAGRLKPVDVRDRGLAELPLPHGHAKKPGVEDLEVEAVAPAVKRWLKSEGIVSEILAIRGVVRADRLFEEGMVLVYESDDGRDFNLGVAVDGRLSQAHEAALGEAGGAERMGIDFEELRRSRVDLAELAPPHLVQQAADDETVRAVEREVEALQREQDASTPLDEETVADPEMVADALADARARLDAIPIRRLRVYEHPPLLRRALSEVRNRLLIISPWISRAVVDDEFVGLLQLACKRGVRIHVGFGIGGDGPQQRPRDPQPERRLRGLATSYTNFTLTELGNTHAKILISDDVWVTTSFNWLSFRGDPDRTYRQEEGLLVRVKDQVDAAYEDFRQQVESGG
jgi:hypothetical protein